jgi:membrane protein implicated in regulation of membrane protease activity
MGVSKRGFRYAQFVGAVAAGAAIGVAGVFFATGMLKALAADAASGNAADWWAAAGTWVIGLGASAIAVMTYMHGRAETTRVRRAYLAGAAVSVVSAATTTATMQRFLEPSDKAKTWGDLQNLVETLMDDCAEIKIDPSAATHVPLEAIRFLVIINRRLRGLRHIFATGVELQRGEREISSAIGEEQIESIAELRDFCVELESDCDSFAAAIRGELEQIK